MAYRPYQTPRRQVPLSQVASTLGLRFYANASDEEPYCDLFPDTGDADCCLVDVALVLCSLHPLVFAAWRASVGTDDVLVGRRRDARGWFFGCRSGHLATSAMGRNGRLVPGRRQLVSNALVSGDKPGQRRRLDRDGPNGHHGIGFTRHGDHLWKRSETTGSDSSRSHVEDASGRQHIRSSRDFLEFVPLDPATRHR